jgi:hypothetical protein
MIKRITIVYKPQVVPLNDYDREIDFVASETLDAENVILRLKEQEEVQLLLLRFMGYNYKEIINIMNLRAIGDYYTLWRKLREDVKIIRQNQI